MSPAVQVEGLSFAAIGQTLRIFLTSRSVIPGLIRNPEAFTTSNSPYHWHFWIPG